MHARRARERRPTYGGGWESWPSTAGRSSCRPPYSDAPQASCRAGRWHRAPTRSASAGRRSAAPGKGRHPTVPSPGSGAAPGATRPLNPSIQGEPNEFPKPRVGGSSPPGGITLSITQRFPCSVQCPVYRSPRVSYHRKHRMTSTSGAPNLSLRSLTRPGRRRRRSPRRPAWPGPSRCCLGAGCRRAWSRVPHRPCRSRTTAPAPGRPRARRG